MTREAQMKHRENSTGRKKNAQSLVDTLRMIRKEVFRESQEVFAASIAAQPQRLQKIIDGRHDIIRIENNQIAITYAILEIYANRIGVPAGVILIFSRFMANQRDERINGANTYAQDNKRLVEGILQIFRSLNSTTKFDAIEFQKWQEYLKEVGEIRGSLFENANIKE